MPQSERENKGQIIEGAGTEQPLMTTGTVEAGFEWKHKDDDPPEKPGIGEKIVGEQSLP
ncbi:hypothetical protein [Peribacillus sp. SCS-155]|uniref:hypothetical protein n=1 Tax=Peribacillus sedimenti TaxID=3115297 RepID=UPI0039060124